jgi:hypothetical protein
MRELEQYFARELAAPPAPLALPADVQSRPA